MRASTPAAAALLGAVLANAAPAAAPRALGEEPAEPAGAGRAVVGIAQVNGAAAPLTLEQCIAQALAENPQLRSERLRERELSGQRWQARSSGLPSVDLRGTWSRSRDPTFLLDESFSGGLADSLPPELAGIDFLPDPDELPAQSFWRASASAEWELNPFRLLNALEAVKISRRQHRADVAAEEHRVAEETSAAFYEVALHVERTAALEADVQAKREFLSLTRRRFELGLATELDTLQAAVSLANLRPTLRRARKDLRNASSRLNILMGRDATAPLAIVPVREIEKDTVNLEAALRRALERPDLESLKLQVRFLDKRKGVIRADQRPSVSMDGSYGYVARSARNLAQRRHDFWQASLSVTLPLFDGFLTKGRVQETEALVARAREDLADARRRARLEAATLLEELGAARENLSAASLGLAAARRARKQVLLRYELGQARHLDVLNAQSEELAARTNLINARYEVLASTAMLKRALGFSPTTPLARVAHVLEGMHP